MTQLLIGIVTALALSLLPLTTVEAGGTDKQKFDKAVGKFVPSFEEAFDVTGPLKTKTLCVCTDSPYKSGFLARQPDDSVLCNIPVFNPDGSFADVAAICFHYEILSK